MKKRSLRKHSSKSPPRQTAFWLALGAVALAAVGAVLLLQRHPPTSIKQSVKSVNLPAASGLEDERKVFAEYAGSASCKDCHEEAYAVWQVSHHGLAERLPGTALDRPAFEPARSFQHASQQTGVRFDGTNYLVTSVGLSLTNEVHPVVRVIGHDPLRQFLVTAPGGRLQTLEASYDPHRNEWFNVYGNEDRRAGEWGHWTGRGMNWNNMCASCHNTRVRKNYDEANDRYHTTMAEATVSCEACHGPLKAHIEWQAGSGNSGRRDPTISRLTRNQTVDYCGYCHARRGELTGDFKPGDHFSDHARLAIVDASDTYFPDGQVREEDYEYASFLSSKMHLRGVICTDCHNPHSARTTLPGNWLCLRCHDGTYANAPVIDPVRHSRHKVFGYDSNAVLTNVDLNIYHPKQIKETGGECVNCHMPQTAYMQRHWRHDHGFTIPDPLLTKEHAVPNACNRCHQDKNADWALGWVDQWYGSKMDRPSRRRAQVIAAARKGEAAARDGLLGLLATEENPYWRAVAAGLLEPWSQEPAVVAALVRSLADTNGLVRAGSVGALEPVVANEPSAVIESLRERLDDPLRNVRIAAAWALRSDVDPSSKAGRELEHWLDGSADQPGGQLQKGNYALARRDPQKALVHFEKAVEWDPNSAPIRHELAVVYSQLNRSAEAVAQLEAACKLEPRNAEFRYKLALAWNEAGQTEKTINGLESAVQLDPTHARAWYNLGLALNSAGRVEEALAALLRAESAAPNDHRNPYARATILARLGRTGEARQAAGRAVDLQPGFAPARELLDSLR